MTIRRRLALSFGAILVLFAANLLLFRWSSAQRTQAVRHLQEAISRQTLVTSIERQIENRRREVDLFSQLDTAGSAPLAAEALAALQSEMDTIAGEIAELKGMASAESLSLSQSLGEVFDELRQSWSVFSTNFGGPNHATAITELVLRSEPLSARVVEVLDSLHSNLLDLVTTAAGDFQEVTALTERLTLSIFLLSVAVAGLIAFRMSRDVGRGFESLRQGVSALSQGDLSNRIVVGRSDELGALAESFNQMAENLDGAQKELAGAARILESRNREIEEERQRAEDLLDNILPDEIADELRSQGRVDPKYFEDVSILFSDFVGFSLAAEKMAVEELVEFLHQQFTAFDLIIQRYGLEKLKTIGDSYMCAGGLPLRNPSHAVDLLMAAFEMVESVASMCPAGADRPWSIRIGIHTGPAIAGIVGIKKFAFDIWGDTVNQSSRMESNSEPGQINISQSTYARVKDFFACRKRGKVLTKEKRKVEMYFVQGILPKLIDNRRTSPPPAFLRRYRIYFKQDPPAFPEFLLRQDGGARQAS